MLAAWSIGIGSLITAGVLLISHWDSITAFLGHMWEKIKTNTGDAVSWLMDKIALLARPFELLKDISLFGDDDSSELRNTTIQNNNSAAKATTLGTALASTTALAAPLSTTELPDNLSAATINNTQAVRIDAPVTINTTPNIDAVAIGNEVQKALDERQARAESERRGNLFDGVQ